MLKILLNPITLVLSLAFLISGVLMIFFLQQKPSLNLSNKLIHQTYLVSPQTYPVSIPVEYPHVSTPPSNVAKYTITSFLEKKDLLNNRFNSLFFAAKRVEEINTWKNELVVHGNIYNLREWWSTNEPIITRPSSFYLYQTWEAQLARYHFAMIEALKNNDTYEYSSDKSPSNLPKYVTTFENKIKLSINNAELNKYEKMYLLKLNNNLHKDIYDKLQLNQKLFINSRLTYNLTELIQDKQFGIYKIQLPAIPNNSATLQALMIDSQKFPIQCDSFMCTAENVPIKYGSSQVHLQYDNLYSELEVDQNKNYSFFRIPIIKDDSTVLMISNLSGSEFKLEISEQFDKNKKNLQQVIFPKSLSDSSTYFIEIQSFEKQLEGKLYETNAKTGDHKNNFSIKWVSQNSPKIKLLYQKPFPREKMNTNIKLMEFNLYRIQTEYISKKQHQELLSNLPFWRIVSINETSQGFFVIVKYLPTTFFFLIFFFSTVILILHTIYIILPIYKQTKYLKILTQITKRSTMITNSVAKHIMSIVIKMKFLLLLFSLSLSFILIFFVTLFSPILFLLLLIFWILTITTFRLNSDFPFFFSYISLAIFLILIIFESWLFAESFVLLSFIFFIIGIALGITENFLRYKTTPLNKILKVKLLFQK